MKRARISILNISLTNGGAEKVISLLLKKLVIDFEVTLILMYNNIHFNIPNEVKVIILSDQSESNLKGLYNKAINTLKFTRKYFNIIKTHKIDIAISFLAFPNFLNGMASLRFPKVKTIISERGFPSLNTTSRLSHYIAKIFYPIFYNRCDKLFSNSMHINKDLKENFAVKIPMEVIYNPIELHFLNKVSDSLLKENHDLKIISVGTLNSNKNQLMVFKALSISEHIDYSLSLLGDGPLLDELKICAENMQLTDKITFYGKVKNVGDYLTKHNCFVLSSFTEGFPNALLEALSYGLPSISTNCVSGPLELLNDNIPVTIEEGKFVLAKYGILINNDDKIGLASALKYLNNNPKERIRYSQQGLERAKMFELDIVYKKFKNFITN